MLSEVYEAKGNLNKALDYYKQYHELNDSILSKDNIDYINELQVKYETEIKENEIKLKETEIQILNQKTIAQRSKFIAISLGLLTLLIAAVGLYYGLRQKYRRQQLEKEKTDAELNFKKQELLAYTTQLVQKNELLESLKKDIEETHIQNGGRSLQKVVNSIDFNLNDAANWENFRARFESVHKDFAKNLNLAYPDLTTNDLRIAALIKMELDSREIAQILNISQDGVKKARYRMRKKIVDGAFRISGSSHTTILIYLIIEYGLLAWIDFS